MKIIICEKCKGIGRLCHDVGTHKTEYEYEVCSVCNGSGRMEEAVSVSLKPFEPGPNKSTRIF